VARRRVKWRTRQQSDELVREVVAAVVPARERARYMTFARELYATLRLKPQASSRKLQAQARATRRVIPTKPVRQAQGRLRAGRNLAAEDRGRDPSIGVGVTEPARSGPQFPDYTRKTKLVIVRWFRRGLHGNLLWRIGIALLGRLFPDAATGKVED
jgi:hypothetical protein